MIGFDGVIRVLLGGVARGGDQLLDRSRIRGSLIGGGLLRCAKLGAGEIVDPGWSDRQGQLVESSEDP